MIIYKLVLFFLTNAVFNYCHYIKKKKVHSIEFQNRFIEYKQFNSGKSETRHFHFEQSSAHRANFR